MDAAFKQILDLGIAGAFLVIIITGLTVLWKQFVNEKKRTDEVLTVVAANTAAMQNNAEAQKLQSQSLQHLAGTVGTLADSIKQGLDIQEKAHAQLAEKLLEKIPVKKE